MRLIATLMIGCVAVVLAGCGGMPKPRIEPVKPRADATHVRVVLAASNYDDAWDKENLRLRCHQVWLNNDGVPTNKEQVFEAGHNDGKGSKRGTIKMKDADGDSTRWVRLTFELVSGENPQSENISAGTTVEWKLASDFNNQDILFVAAISRKSRNNYQIDVLYALNPETGEIEQVLPSSDEE